MDVCVPSMMHSGTHLIRLEVFKGWGEIGPAARVRLQANYNPENFKNHILCGHLVNSWMDIWEAAFKDVGRICTPLRHPVRMLESYRRRKKPKRFFEEQWKNMVEIVQYYSPLYLHVDDKKIRDKEVELIGKSVGETFHTDWPVGAVSGAHQGTHDLEITEDREKEIPKEFIDFYNYTRKQTWEKINKELTGDN